VPSGSCQRVVNDPAALTHTLKVRPIRVSKTSGEIANVFGNEYNERFIKRRVNQIMTQAGIRVDWLPLADYINDFAYDGSPANYYSGAIRPQSHVYSVIDDPAAAGFTSDPTIINIFFIKIVPNFGVSPTNQVNGTAKLDAGSLTIQVGAYLLTLDLGLDLVASVICHEIGHNLGLLHPAGVTANLMASGGSTDQLTPSQISTMFINNGGFDGFELLHPITPSRYDLWAYNQFLPESRSDDYDQDGLTTLQEFVFSTDPQAPSFFQLPNPIDTPAGVTWTVSKNPASDDVATEIQVSTDLKTWLSAGSAGSQSTVLTNTASQVTVRMLPQVPNAYFSFKID
jgi:hypothetical protein